MTSDEEKIRLILELRHAGIANTTLLSAIERTPRELFLPAMFRARAYDNVALPIGHGQTISQPQIVAIMTQALELDERMKVLEVGTGSGYQAAILARLCRRVYTIERDLPLLNLAKDIFRRLDLHNIITKWGDGFLGWVEQAPFKRIIVTAASAEIPPALLEQLCDGGVMIIPLGERDQELVRIRKTGQTYTHEPLCPVRFVPLLRGTSKPSDFLLDDLSDF